MLSSKEVTFLKVAEDNPISIRCFGAQVPAGFPSPALDYMEEEIDLEKYLRPRPSSTFIVRVQGDSMKDANIPDGAILIVDRSLKPLNNRIIVAVVNSEFTVKRFVQNSSGMRLMPANPKYQPIPITDGMEFSVWGVVTKVIIDALL